MKGKGARPFPVIDYSQPIFNAGHSATEVVDTWNEVEREEGRGSSGHRWPLIDQRVDIIEGVNGQSMNGRDFDTVFRTIVVIEVEKLWEED